MTRLFHAVVSASMMCFLTIVYSVVPLSGQTSESDGDVKPNIAVTALKAASGMAAGECELITDRLRVELFNTHRVNVMERDQMQEILKEQGFQQSGACTEEACLVQMGQVLGVSALVTGSIGKLGSLFMINVRMVDIQTARITRMLSRDVKGDVEDVVTELRSIANELVTTGTAAPSRIGAKIPPAAAEPEVVSPGPKPVAVTEPDKPRRRFGVGIVSDFHGPIRHLLDGQRSDSIYLDLNYKTSDGNTVNYPTAVDATEYQLVSTPAVNLMIRFSMSRGQFMKFMIGPGFLSATENYTLNYPGDTTTFEVVYAFPYLGTGFLYVRELRRLRLNAGLTIDFGSTMVFCTYSKVTSLEEKFVEDVFTEKMIALGFRGGIEWLIGSHIGLGGDLIFRHLAQNVGFNLDPDGLTDGHGAVPGRTQSVQYPGLGYGLGVNYYF